MSAPTIGEVGSATAAATEGSLMADIYQDIEAEIPCLRRYAWRLARDLSTADDLVQDCLARALAKVHLWQEGTDLRAWLLTILHNQHVNHVRSDVRAGQPVELKETEPLLIRAPDQEDRLQLRDLERALAQLPETQRAAILLVGLEGMRYDEVAKVLGIQIGTVRSRLSRGRDALRELTGDPTGASGRRTKRAASKAYARQREAHRGRKAQWLPTGNPSHASVML
jgi:RNA polymerase sigma-70 factor (ECF subfamily)